MMCWNILCIISLILVIVGALNWGIVAINPDYNLVEKISMKNKTVERVIYGLVALGGLTLVIMMIYNKFNSPSDERCNKWRDNVVDRWNKKCSGRTTLSSTPHPWK